MSQNKNEDKKLTEGEVLDGCSGCLSIGCLPFSLLTLVIIGTIFNHKDLFQNLVYMIYDFIF